MAYHWIPFDEQALKRALGLRGRDLEAYLYNDHHTLAELASRRGIEPERLADELIAPWRSRVDDHRFAVLRDRTLRLLTQGHLAQHVFFHVFHNGGASQAIAERLGISAARLRSQRAHGLTWLEIARRRGVRPAVLRDHLAEFFRDHQRRGIQLGFSSAAESARVLARQLAALPCWLRRHHPVRDAGNPYGKAMLQHGEHSPGWPATSSGRHANEVRVERVRRSLRRSCWRPPARWSWPVHGLDPPWRADRARPSARPGWPSERAAAATAGAVRPSTARLCTLS